MKNDVKNKLTICLILMVAPLTAGLIQPENNSNLNYIHILFEWEQMSNADSYQLIGEWRLFNFPW